jgi:hypothetical protein
MDVTQFEAGIKPNDIDEYTNLCLFPKATGDRKWKVKVYAVNTNPGPLLDNWKNSLQRLGYDHEVIGEGEKWGGWPWRTRKYIEKLANETKEKIFVLTDANDVFFIGRPEELIENFRSYGSDVVVGAEHACSTGPMLSNYSLKATVMNYCKARNPNSRFIVPNGGFVMGFRTPLLNLLCANLDQADDQHGYLVNWLAHPEVFKLDIHCRLVANVVYNFPMMDYEDDERIDSDFLKFIETRDGRRVIQIESGAMPCVMHFPGKNFEAYNYFGPRLLGSRFNMLEDQKYTFLSTIKKSWVSNIKDNLGLKFLTGCSRILGNKY